MPPPTAWTPARARIQLKLSIQRTRILATKKSQLAKSTRREIANLLDKGKVESARIKVEGIMQEDLMCELLELLELFCEVLLARFGLLETIKLVLLRSLTYLRLSSVLTLLVSIAQRDRSGSERSCSFDHSCRTEVSFTFFSPHTRESS
jgi:hypothetical protein